MKEEDLIVWAFSRETDFEVAEAIDYVAGHDPDEMQRVWENPTCEEWLAIWERFTHNGLKSGDDYEWGEGVLGNVYPGLDEEEGD